MPRNEREPDFENLLKVLRCERPDRPTLFEFFMDDEPLHHRMAPEYADWETLGDRIRMWIASFRRLGYDYATIPMWLSCIYGFPAGPRKEGETVSLNEGFVMTDRESFERYPWPVPDEDKYAPVGEAEKDLPDGMKLILSGPGGVLENVIGLVGYENLCFLIADDPELVDDIFAAVGERLVTHYRIAMQFDSVGAAVSNDDWGFKTQPMLAPDDLRRFLFPWHKRIVETIHAAGKPAILHSCGNPESIMEDVIEAIGYDGRHSYEDNIIPVEAFYDRWGGRIAVLGGIDIDFVCRATPEEVHKRSLELIERTEAKGGYALGTGNSVADYVPLENYFAMISAATGLEYDV